MLRREVDVRAIVQFTAPKEEDVRARLDELAEAGLQIDPRYGGRGAICVNLKDHKFVARGELGEEALKRIRSFGRYEVFADTKIVPSAGR